MTPAISIQNVGKRFRSGWFGKPIDALRDVSFQVERGQIFGLLGPNGAGKTTLIKVLLGIIRRSTGSATLLGFPAGDRRGRIRVGYLPEQLRLARHQTARTALEFYGRLSGLTYEQIRQRRERLLELVGLQGRDRESVRRFSKGMQQRLGLAQSLLHDPEVLILDEPTDGLDPVGRSQIRTILQQLRDEGRTVFLNSHLLQEVELVCDRVAILHQGELRFVGSIADLTPTHDAAVQLELAGEESTVRAALSHRETAAVRVMPTGNVYAEVPVNGQPDADQLVDQLRKHGVSILRLARRKKTLEDAFLELISVPVEVA